MKKHAKNVDLIYIVRNKIIIKNLFKLKDNIIRGKFMKKKHLRSSEDDETPEGVIESSKKAIDETLEENIKEEDCIVYLKSLDPNSAELILTDPPYDISRKTGFKGVVNGVKRFAVSMDFGKWDHSVVDLDTTIKECFKVLKQHGTIIIFYDLWKITTLANLLTKHGFKQLRFIEWVKTNPVPLNSKVNYLTNSREIAITAVKGGKPTFNSKYDIGCYHYPINHEKNRIHPTQKPLKLIEDLILKHSNEGDTVVDPFLGGGTTVVAAIKHNRKACGCENNKKIYEKMIRRLHDVKTHV